MSGLSHTFQVCRSQLLIFDHYIRVILLHIGSKFKLERAGSSYASTRQVTWKSEDINEEVQSRQHIQLDVKTQSLKS